MNKRIKELAVQAGMWRQHYDIGEESPADLKYFAELIVRECATLAYDGPGGILEHFGVEE